MLKRPGRRDSLQALSKLARRVDGHYQIVSQPPIVIPLRDLAPEHGVSRKNSNRRCANSSAHTGTRCRTTAAAFWKSFRSSTSPARSSEWGASVPGRS